MDAVQAVVEDGILLTSWNHRLRVMSRGSASCGPSAIAPSTVGCLFHSLEASIPTKTLQFWTRTHILLVISLHPQHNFGDSQFVHLSLNYMRYTFSPFPLPFALPPPIVRSLQSHHPESFFHPCLTSVLTTLDIIHHNAFLHTPSMYINLSLSTLSSTFSLHPNFVSTHLHLRPHCSIACAMWHPFIALRKLA